MITYSDLLEARQHLQNAIHHAGLAGGLVPSATITEAVSLMEGALANVIAMSPTSGNYPPRSFDDTKESA